MTNPDVVKRLEAIDVAIYQLAIDPALSHILMLIIKELVVIHNQIDKK